MLDTLHWDLPRLFDEIKVALRKAASGGAKPEGIGLDTWGVDFGLIGRGDTLLGNPVHYRDARTDGMIDAACRARAEGADLRDHRPAIPAVQHRLPAAGAEAGRLAAAGLPPRRC